LVSGSPVGLYLLCEPVVVSFYHDHGVDVTEAAGAAIADALANARRKAPGLYAKTLRDAISV